MPSEFEIRGAEQFADLARALRKAGDKDLRRELYRALNRSTKPLKAAAKRSASERLPKRGGLAQRVAGARLSTRSRAGRNPSIRIEAKEGRKSIDVRAADDGRVRHPLFGHSPWFEQAVPAGWFTEPMQAGADEVRQEIMKALDDVAAKLAAKGG